MPAKPFVFGTFPPFDPTHIASLWAMYEADSYSQADGSNIATDWEDLSGNGRDAPVTGTPTFETGELNSLPVIRMGADSNDIFTFPDMSALTAGAFFEVLKVNTGAGVTNFSDGFGSGGPGNLYPFNDDLIYDNFGSTTRKDFISPSVTITNWHVLHGHSAASDWGLFQNGSSIHSTGTNTVGFSATPTLGQSGVATKKDVAGLYLFSAKPNSGQITNMLAYINKKWAI
jgi:hypothetical protein